MTNLVAATPADSSSIQRPTKLQQATQEFEAMLLAELLKSGPKMGSLGGDESGSSEQYGDLSMQAVAQAMSAHGGIGISRMLLKQLEIGDKAEIKGFSSPADSLIAGE